MREISLEIDDDGGSRLEPGGLGAVAVEGAAAEDAECQSSASLRRGGRRKEKAIQKIDGQCVRFLEESERATDEEWWLRWTVAWNKYEELRLKTARFRAICSSSEAGSSWQGAEAEWSEELS